MERVKVYDRNNVPVKTGVGIFARIFMDHFPLLPVEEEGRLHEPGLRENFIERIFTLKRWREAAALKGGLENLIAFHTRYKLLILSHSPKHYQEMGKRVARAKGVPLNSLYDRYQELLLEALRLKTTPPQEHQCFAAYDGVFQGPALRG
jgi:hypothetical protein